MRSNDQILAEAKYLDLNELTDHDSQTRQLGDLVEENSRLRFDNEIKAPLSGLQFLELGIAIINLIMLIALIYSVNNLDKLSSPLASACSTASSVAVEAANSINQSTHAFNTCIQTMHDIGRYLNGTVPINARG